MDPWRKLQVVNAANPSLRLSVAPQSAQPSAPLRVAQSQPAQQIRVPQGTPRPVYTPEPVISRPKQGFWNKARDILDANTEADKYRRQQGNFEKVRIGGAEAAGQKPIVSENPGNIISNTIGAIPRTFNTAANQIVEVGYTAQQQFATSEYSKAVQELLAAQKSGDKARYDLAKVRADNASQRVGNINDLIKATKSNYKENSGGLFNAGTMYNEQDSYEGKLSTGLRKIGGNTVEGMFDVASLGLTGVAAKQVAKQGIKQTLKTSGGIIAKNAALNTGQGAASSFRQGGDLKDVAITAAASGTIGSVADVALAGVGGSLLKQVGKARAGAITKQLSDYFVAETNETAIKTMLGNNLNVPANKIDSIAKYVAKENNPKAINKLVQELSIDPNLELTPDVINQLRDGGITAVRRDKDAQYQAQYKDGVITARGQKELDDHVYHELGHHLYNTRLTPEERAIFTGQGNASKQAVGRPGYTQDNVNAEDFADYLNMASRGRINDVPKEYQAIIRKYAKIAEAQSNDVVSTGRVKSVANKELVNQGLTGSRVTRRKLTDLTLGSDALGDVDPAQVADYTNRIRLGENIDPVIVTKGSDGQYYVVDGKHRLEAMKELGITDVPTVEVPGKNSGITNADIIAAKQGVGDIQDATAKATGETAEPTVATAGTPSVAAQVSSDQAVVTKQVSDKAAEPVETYYHGSLSPEGIEQKGFSLPGEGSKSLNGQNYGNGIYLTNDLITAKDYAQIGESHAGKVFTVKLDDGVKLYKPKDVLADLFASDTNYGDPLLITKKYQAMGYDGIEIGAGNVDTAGIKNYQKETIIFDPKKVSIVREPAPGATQVGKTVEPTEPPASILKTQPEVDPNFNPTPRQAGFAQSLSQTSTPKAVYDDLLEITTKPNPQTFAQASQDIVANEQGILKDILGKSKDSLNDVDNARALLLLDKAIADDNIPLATQLASKINSSATENARAVQILSAIDKTSPAGAFKEAQKIVTEAQEKKLLPENYTIPPEKLASINERAKFIQTLEMGTREHDIAVGELLADLKSIVPVTIGDKLNSIVNISLLLNPKTFIRNVIGNTAGNVAETVSTAVSTPIDWLVSLRTGKRSVALPSVIEKFGGFGQGLKEGFEETNKGIRLGIGGNSKYDINTPVFENRVGRWMEKALGHSLSDLDKAFATSQMRDTINSLMKATGAKKPTQEMIDIAGHEALYATYQGDSFIAKSLMGLKGWLNKANVKGFGLGDVVVRYPKTPGNLVAVGMDYSPYGFAKGLVQFVRLNKGTSLAAQREAVRNLGRGITGTGLIAGGYYLAQNDIITAKKSSDKDLNSLQRQQGQPPFSFNITALGRLMRGEDTKAREGDVVSTYDWLQPNAIQLSMGANMALNKDEGSTDAISTILDQAATGLETIEEQPVLAQTGRFFKTAMTPADQGGGIPNAIVDSVTGLPSMFVPSVVNQTAASIDNTARTTYDPNPVKQGYNKVVGKLPFANQSLQPAIDTFGNEIKRQQTDNPITRVFNSFVNPAFVTKIKRTPEGQMVLDIYNRSGETGQIPRVAARKQQVNLDGGDDSTASSYTLSGKELTEFQKLTGRLAKETFAELANNPSFMALPDEEKAAEMQKRLTEINSYAKITLLGNKPKTTTEGVKALLSGRVGDFASKSPENVTGLAKQYYDKTAYMDEATYKEWLNGAPDEVATATAKELNKARPQYTNELQAYNGLTKRYAEYQKSIADAKKEGSWTKLDEVEKDQEFWKGAIKDGRDDLTRDIYDAGSSGSKDYWEKGYITKEDIDKAIALDDELYASGLTKSLKFSKTFRREYGYGIPDSADDAKKRASGGGSGGGKGKQAKLKTVQGLNELKLRFNPTAAPDVSAVPRTASKRLKFDVPSAVQVKPVRLKL